MQTVHPHFDISFGCFVFGLRLFAFQKITVGFGLSFFIGGGMDCSFLRLRGVLLWSIVGITADRDIVPILLDVSPFHQICRVQNDRKTAFVQLKLQENRYSIQYKPLTIQTIPHRYQPKQSIQSRSAQILRKTIAKPTVAAGTNSPSPPIMKNVRYQPNNPTETRTIPARTQIVKLYPELGIIDLHRIQKS